VFKAIRIGILLFILFFVAVNTWLTQARSTDWNNSLWIKIYPINADGSEASDRYIESLDIGDFAGIEAFIKRETDRYNKTIDRPLRIELGNKIAEQPPVLEAGSGMFGIMLWSIKMRWWASDTAGEQDSIEPDGRIFVRFIILIMRSCLRTRWVYRKAWWASLMPTRVTVNAAETMSLLPTSFCTH